MDMPDRIRIAREAASLTQEELAAKLRESTGRKVAAVIVSRWERGVAAPGSELLVALAAAVGRSPEWLRTGIERGDSAPVLADEVLAAVAAQGMRAPDADEARYLAARGASSTGWTPAAFVALLQQMRLGEVAASQHFVDADVPRRVR